MQVELQTAMSKQHLWIQNLFEKEFCWVFNKVHGVQINININIRK